MSTSVLKNRKKLIIFISSPGDVQKERIIADRAIRKLQKEYGAVVELTPILWENLPLSPTQTFQAGIDSVLRQDGIDIAVFILGNRLGSSPGRNYLKADGTPYQSGTEYEYDFIQQMHKNAGRPEILVYVKLRHEKDLLQRYNSLSEASEANKQNELVKKFIQERFEDKDLGAYLAYHQISEEANFESRITEHLRKLIQKLQGNIALPNYAGNPYKGLSAFQKGDENIFFGRSKEVIALEAKIIEYYALHKEIPFVFVCGTSGAGKSSFVRAGILPDFESTSLVSDSIAEARIFTPLQGGGSLSAAILDNLKELLPELLGNKYFTALYQMEHISSQDIAVIDEAVSRKTESGKKFIPIIFIDQFEEFFTDSRINAKEKIRSKSLLAALQQTGNFMFIFSLRSDFYHHLTTDEELLQIRKKSIYWDISPLTSSEFREVIESPALLAGASWEKSTKTGEVLCNKILDDAIKLQSLPLLEFALTALYEKREGNCLTFDCYNKIGGIAGAIENYANSVFNTLNNRQKEIFFKLLSLVISVSDDGTYCRKNAVLSEYNLTDEELSALNFLVEKRLFYTSSDTNEEAVFSIAHEFLINNWNLLKTWMQKEKEFIVSRKRFEFAAVCWEEHGKASSYLISSRSEIDEAEDLLLCRGKYLPHNLCRYLLKSIKHTSGRWKWIISFSLLFFNALWVGGAFAVNYFSRYEICSWNVVNYLFLNIFLVFSKFYTVPSFKKVYSECIAYGILLLSTAGCAVNEYLASEEFAPLDYVIVPLFAILFFIKLYGIIKFRLRRKRIVAFSHANGIVQFFRNSTATLILCSMFLFSYLYLLAIYEIMGEMLRDIRIAFANQDHLKVNELLVDFGENEALIGINSLDSKYFHAKLYYDSGLPLKALNGLGEELQDEHEKTLYYQILVDLNRGAERADLAYSSEIIQPWIKVWIALFYGNEVKAAELASTLSAPDTDNISAETMNYAHWLLIVKKDIEQALQIYKKHLGKTEGTLIWDNELRYDFVCLKKYEKFRPLVLKAEEAIGLLPIPVLQKPGIDIIKELPQLQGKWLLVNNDVLGLSDQHRLYWEIDLHSEIPSYYNMYYKNSGEKEKLVLRTFSHLEINKIDGKDNVYKLQEFNPRNNAIAVAMLYFEDDNTMKVVSLFNGLEKEKVYIYKRI